MRITKSMLITGILLTIPFLINAQDQLNKSFSGIKKITMTTGSGDCKIQKSADATVKVLLKHTYTDSGYQPTAEQEGDRLIIKEKSNGHNNSGDAHWTLIVPAGLDISFTTGSGNLDATDISFTNLKTTTGSGDLSFTNLKGTIKGATGSGNVKLSTFDGEIKVNTGSGDMTFDKVKGQASMNCGSGDIRITDSQASFASNTGSGNISATNITLTGSAKFNTGSGNATLRLTATPKFDIAINSGSGDATVDFGGNEIVGEIVMRASKKHGTISAPFEFDKTEEIENGGSDVTIQKTVVKGNGTNKISIGTGSGDAVLKK